MVAARADIAYLNSRAIVFVVVVDLREKACVRGQVMVVILMSVVSARLVDSINLRAVNTLPQSPVRQLPII